MKKYNKYEDWVELVSESLPEIPKIITEEWLKEQLLDRSSYFRNWGFCFNDLSNYQFEENIDFNIIRKVPFSTKTIFPEKHPFHFNKENIFYVDKEIKDLHNKGINGNGINVAVIDFAYETVPSEIEESLVSYKNCTEEIENHFHGIITSTQICGKNLGVAPKSKLWFYGTRQGKNHINDTILGLEYIYEQNEKGANIKIISIPASNHRLNPEYEKIREKLMKQGCYIIDSPIFGENFTSINQDPNTGELYYSDWQLLPDTYDEMKSKIAIKTGGKMTPLVTTKDEYLYCGQATYSWSIPILSGYFALALQINPDLTYDEFIDLVNDTKKNENGIMLFNINDVIEKMQNEHLKKR